MFLKKHIFTIFKYFISLYTPNAILNGRYHEAIIPKGKEK